MTSTDLPRDIIFLLVGTPAASLPPWPSTRHG
jgi:hypothetical protein